jgi:tetratricopeptide (TPR) repeat protein
LAWLLALKEGPNTEALTLVQRAIDLWGPQPDFLDTRAVILLTMNQPSAAIADLEQVIRLKPSPAAYFHLARAHYQAQDRARAVASFQQAKDQGLTPLTLHPLERRTFNHLLGALQD